MLELLQESNVTRGMFTRDNLCISGTHTHSGPAGFLTHTVFQVSSLGFIKQSYEAMSNGIARSIIRAVENIEDGVNAHIAEALVDGANINRSPSAYLLNPEEERSRYANDTDQNMQVNFQSKNGSSLGVLNWYAVHGTSMNNTNRLISGDNRGLASYMFERQMERDGSKRFVAAFASTNLGDVSPNTAGPHCLDTGKPCDVLHSTCGGRNELCVASGPGKDMFESTQIIAEKQYAVAKALHAERGEELSEVLDYRHSYVQMPGLNVTLPNGTVVQTCGAAFGYSFAAGTTDGPGAFNFTQGTTTGNPFWDKVSGLLSKPTAAQRACHHPKPILLNLEGIQKAIPLGCGKNSTAGAAPRQPLHTRSTLRADNHGRQATTGACSCGHPIIGHGGETDRHNCRAVEHIRRLHGNF